MARESTRHLVLAAFFLALGLLMPFLTTDPALGAPFAHAHSCSTLRVHLEGPRARCGLITRC